MIEKSGYKYEIVNKTVKLWHDFQNTSEDPCLLQDMHSDGSGKLFISDEEAQAWAESFIDRPPLNIEEVEEPVTE